MINVGININTKAAK